MQAECEICENILRRHNMQHHIAEGFWSYYIHSYTRDGEEYSSLPVIG